MTIFKQEEWLTLKEQYDLSDRLLQVTKSILLGESDSQIAYNLNISQPTVRTYINRIFAKIGVSNRIELALTLFSEFRVKCHELECPRLSENFNLSYVTEA